MNIYLDIETIPTEDVEIIAEIADNITPPKNISKAETLAKWHNEKKPGLITEAIDKTALGPVVPPHIALGRVLCIGYAIDDAEPKVLVARTADEEAQIIMEASRLFGDNYLVIGHNVKEFDLTYLAQRSSILGLKESAFVIGGFPPHFDTMLTWTGHYTRHVSLDWLCRVFKVKRKGEISGKDVARLYRAGEIDRIAEYCKQDVDRVREVFMRMTLKKGPEYA